VADDRPSRPQSIPAYPFWSLTIFALDVTVIYGLAAYGGDPRLAARDQLRATD
jgi:hypothetical protein